MTFKLPLVENEWQNFIDEQLKKQYFQDLISFISKEYRRETVYPKKEDIFNAFKLTNFSDVKVVIIGQDPYYQPNYAHGLSFSVPNGVRIPRSLNNIYKEYAADLKLPTPKTGNLEKWSKEGVLLLNATLTVRHNKAGSHCNKGWEIFTNNVVLTLSQKREDIIFLLWGNNALKKAAYIDEEKHLILASAHPSPLSAHRGFFSSKPFSKTNKLLSERGLSVIDWEI